MKTPATSHVGLIRLSGYMIKYFVLRHNKCLWPGSFSLKLTRLREPQKGKNARSLVFLLTMDFSPTIFMYTEWGCRSTAVMQPDLKESNLNPSAAVRIWIFKAWNEQLWAQRKRKKWHKSEKRTRVKSYFNSNQAVVSAVRLQAELTQHRNLRKWKPQY